ncbi:MAG: tetratricopeptide repeat protein [Saprospiraceae bacterium]|nr:tetratricopeptide repeat protein [Saprospiraceae bacterium]
MYYDQNDYQRAEAAFAEALKIYRRLAKDKPQAFEPKVAMVQYDLGGLYTLQNDYPKAEAAFREALEIHRKLAEEDPDAYLPELAGSLFILGALMSDNNSNAEARVLLSEAFEIFKTITTKYPNKYDLNMCRAAIFLVSLYIGKEAREALEILDDTEKRLGLLPKNNPKVYYLHHQSRIIKSYFQGFIKD